MPASVSASASFASDSSHFASEYWLRARTPLASLVFLAPLLVVYEAGVRLLGAQDPESLRNGADYWMRDWLATLGLSHTLLLPGLLLAALIIWHVLARDPWRVRPETFLGMFAESVAFACCLIAIGQMHNMLFNGLPELKELSIATSPHSARVIAFIGAGVYEEVLFRLCLVPAAYGVFRMLEFPGKGAAVLAVVSTSFMFALAHYVGPAADTFSVFSFSFRAIAGAFFAGLFILRGFGITVGAHAAYDVFVGVLFASA